MTKKAWGKLIVWNGQFGLILGRSEDLMLTVVHVPRSEPRVYAGTDVSHSHHRKKMGEVFEKNVGWLVSWCFKPSQPQRITSGLNTNLTIQVKYYFTSHHRSTNHVFLAYLYAASTQHGNLHPAGWPILFCRLTQEKNWERFWKKCRWTDWKGRNKQGRTPWQ